jgi:Ca-activated chloride channel family protein
MAAVEFIHPKFLWGLLTLPLLFMFLFWAEYRRRAALRLIGEQEMLAVLMPRLSVVRRWTKGVLWLLVITLLIIVAARPTWGIRTDIVETQGVSVFVLLDVSNSMNAEDVVPSRLERAKIGVYDLLEGVEGNEVGVIAFAGTAFVVFPLTTDIASAQTFLTYITSDVVSRQGTAISTAIDLALQSFNDAEATEKVIVIFSDGEDHTTEAEAAIRAAVDAGVTVHAIGYGTDGGGSIPIRNSSGLVVGNKMDRVGNIVITTLNEALLKEATSRTGGIYQSIDAADSAVSRIIRAINTSEGGALGEDETSRGVERFSLFAAIALLILSFEMVLSETKSS